MDSNTVLCGEKEKKCFLPFLGRNPTILLDYGYMQSYLLDKSWCVFKEGMAMRRRFSLRPVGSFIYALIAAVFGVPVLLSYFVDSDSLRAFRFVFVQWTLILGAFALLLGALNVFSVHVQRIRRRQGIGYSLILITAMLVVIVLGLGTGPGSELMSWIFQYTIFPLQATIFSLLAFFVVTAAYRAFRVRSWETALFMVIGLIVLLGQIPIGVLLEKWLPVPRAAVLWDQFTLAKSWLMAVPGMAGVRGIILGVALGTVVTGLRLLLGMDRPYSDR